MPQKDRKLKITELDRIPAGAYAPRMKVAVVLDDLRSAHNVGSIFRSADSFGIERILLCGFTPCPPQREIEKTALGATVSVPWEHHQDVITAISKLKDEGYKIVAVEQTQLAIPIEKFQHDPNDPIALVFGNELSGVSDRVIQLCDQSIVLPQFGTKHSLNVSVCAGIVLWWFTGREH